MLTYKANESNQNTDYNNQDTNKQTRADRNLKYKKKIKGYFT
jgi:hypothetical protein